MGVYWGALYVQIHGKYKDKTKQKQPEVEEAREGNGQPGATTGHHGRGDNHGQAVVPTAVVVAWFFTLGRRFLPFLGYFGPLLAIIF